MIGLRVIVVVLVLLQRFVVPGTAISVALPVVIGVTALLAILRAVRGDPLRFAWFAAAVAVAVVATVVSATESVLGYSLGSLLLLLVAWIPCCCRASPTLRARFPELLRFFQNIMIVPALACCGQWLGQMAGWTFEDLLGFVPPQMLASTTEFNLSYPIYYGSDLYKANGVVFLEPSFASQLLALAIIIQLILGGSRWKIALYALALLATLSGTGFVLLIVGISVLSVQRGGRWAFGAAATLGVVVAILAVSPIGNVLLERSGESAQEGSSGNARFVAPYTNVLAAVSTDSATLLIGRGPGSVTRDSSYFNPLGVEANYPALPKFVAEYGLPAALLFFSFVMLVLFRRTSSSTLSVMAMLLLLVLSSSLLQPAIIYLCWVLTGLFARGDERGPRPSRCSASPAPRYVTGPG